MSRWLSQVTNYLEQLDDQAQDYVEENINAPQEAVQESEVSSNLDSILAQRGLTASSEDNDDDDDIDLEFDDPFGSSSDDPFGSSADFQEETAVPEPAVEEQQEVVEPPPVEPESEQSGQPSSEESDKKEPDVEAVKPEVVTKPPETKPGSDENENKSQVEAEKASEKKVETPNEEDKSTAETAKKPAPPAPVPNPDKTPETAKEEKPKPDPKPQQPPPPPPKPAPRSAPQPKQAPAVAAPKPPPPPIVKDPNPALVKQAKEAQKEVRTLRKHMLTLNQQLESVEAEVTAQRKELEQAAVRMEKDRAKAKEERDKERKRHAEEQKSLQAQHEAMLIDQKTRLEKQLKDLSEKLKQTEQTRMQEGGNWDKEMQGAVEREQLLARKNVALEDEKATLLAQISTLQSQQEVLGDRIESLSQAADTAMEREREAEERLDQALSVHAHQISQRQARESELERTIADLGSAMAAVRNKESSRLADYSKKSAELSDTAGENTSQDSGLRVRLDMALHDLETAQANLDLERQRTEALQRELREINGERTEEATDARIKQNKHDRQIAELTLQLTRLQQQQSNGDAVSERKESKADEKEVSSLKSQIKELSEEVLKAREKTGGYSSEIAALKSRLKGAVDRADKAEAALEDSLATAPSADSLDRMEMGSPSSGNFMRKRGGKKGPATITSAMHLNKTERVGKAVDTLDSFAVSTGKYLRYNPMARAAFIMYLLMLHLWTFVVIFFHAHNFEDIHRGDSGIPHGPDAIAQQQLGQAAVAAVSAAKAAAAAAVADVKEKP